MSEVYCLPWSEWWRTVADRIKRATQAAFRAPTPPSPDPRAPIQWSIAGGSPNTADDALATWMLSFPPEKWAAHGTGASPRIGFLVGNEGAPAASLAELPLPPRELRFETLALPKRIVLLTWC